MKQYLVIGLGSFGSSVLKTLYEAGEEVLGIDSKETEVQEIVNSNYAENAVILDATDDIQLKKIGVKNFDIVFVCVGAIEPSIMITLNLKELGVKKLIAKASSKKHRKLLEKVGANQVIYPEEYMGKRTALIAMEPNMIEHLRFSQDFLLAEIKAPSVFWGQTIIEANIRKNYNVNIVGIKKATGKLIPNPTANTKLEKDDILIVVTDSKTANKLNELIKKEFKED
ncbi:MAG: TrkA family potassium uptake protein [Fusobacterium sp.]|uniref:potassium channel family protein n=1 Tax=Fusobacterium sp. IOR10 TaxID=2665157 RepID=UPI0013D2389B|nr:TrkA family potassium uptake protein [Fusobacterium sp. IOR10]